MPKKKWKKWKKNLGGSPSQGGLLPGGVMWPIPSYIWCYLYAASTPTECQHLWYPPVWTEWQTGAKILPCPKLRLRLVFVFEIAALCCKNVRKARRCISCWKIKGARRWKVSQVRQVCHVFMTDTHAWVEKFARNCLQFCVVFCLVVLLPVGRFLQSVVHT